MPVDPRAGSDVLRRKATTNLVQKPRSAITPCLASWSGFKLRTVRNAAQCTALSLNLDRIPTYSESSKLLISMYWSAMQLSCYRIRSMSVLDLMYSVICAVLRHTKPTTCISLSSTERLISDCGQPMRTIRLLKASTPQWGGLV